MQITIELDEKTVAEIDATAKDFNKDRIQYISDFLRKSLSKDRRKSKYSEEDIRRMYREAYSKQPMQPDEFEIEEDQLVEVWKDL